jgi:hypothetical protein
MEGRVRAMGGQRDRALGIIKKVKVEKDGTRMIWM